MLEKLSEYEITSRDGDFINVDCNTKIINTLVRKINELVDAVNELQMKVEPEKCEAPAENVQKEALTMALETLHAIAHWGPWKDDREEYAEKAHTKICELLAKGGSNE